MERITKHRYHEVARYPEELEYRTTCVECGEDFYAKRYDAAFCSSTCRSREHRRRANRGVRIAQALYAIDEILKSMPRTGDSPEFEACQKIIRRVTNAVNNVEK